jgi:hypothetical protein
MIKHFAGRSYKTNKGKKNEFLRKIRHTLGHFLYKGIVYNRLCILYSK